LYSRLCIGEKYGIRKETAAGEKGVTMSALSEYTGSFMSQDGLTIFYRKYQANPERARMVISHGLGEHSGRYGTVIERLQPKGITIWAPDHRGHGKSDGPRGHILAFEEYLDDLKRLATMARKDLPEGMKCFLLGHSMGGLIALTCALRVPGMIDGVIVSSPTLGLRATLPVIKRTLGKIMSSIWPGMTLSNEIDAAKLSHDEGVVQAYMNDFLVHDRVSARWFTEFLHAMETVNHQASELEVPILMQVAGDDYIVDAHASKTFYERLNLGDRTLHFYDGLYHEVYNEKEEHREQVLTDLEDWLERHI
jgi:alpha-beta hydrolase superfamily lysophospholipase